MRRGVCVDASQPDGRLVLHGCHGGPNQKFTGGGLPQMSEDIIQVLGPWEDGQNCIDYDFEEHVAYLYTCHGRWNQRWTFTAKDELRVGGDNCLEYDEGGDVAVRPCNGLAKQKWVAQSDGHVQPRGYQAADGSFVSMDDKCLDVSLQTARVYLYDCITDQVNQKFLSDVLRPKSQDLITVDGPWVAGANCVDYNYDTDEAYVYSCHGRDNQQWELTADSQLRSSHGGMCLTLDSGEKAVRMTPCAADDGLQQWRVTRDGHIQPMGYRTSGGSWHALAAKCLSATKGSGVLVLTACDAKAPFQKFRSRTLSSMRDHVYTGKQCLAADDSAVVTTACASVRAQVWEFTRSSELRVDGRCLAFRAGAAPTLASCDGRPEQKWKPSTNNSSISPRAAPNQCLTSTGSSAVTLATCDGSTKQQFPSGVFASVGGPTASLFESAASLLDAAVDDKALSVRVLAAAAAMVSESDKALTSSSAADAAAARKYLLEFLFSTASSDDYSVPVKVLYATAQSNEFLLVASVLIAAAQSNGPTLEAVSPFVRVFSDQLYGARREVLWNRVLLESAEVLEASADGSLDDFDLLGGSLVAVCRAVPLDLSMCGLAHFFQLMDQFTTLRHRLIVEGASAMSDRTLALAKAVATQFSASPLAASDPLWMRIMTLFMFRAPFIDVLPDDVIARASAPDAFLPALVVYSFFGTKNAVAAPLEAQVRFLSDQITSFHYTKLLSMAEMRDMDALDDYMTTSLSALPLVGPINNYTSSDFPILVEFVAPRVCDELQRVPLSLCQLEIFHRGLQSVLRFERQRRNNVVTLDDVLEVDVRKKLDVIDQEKKQYEIISTLQTVANKIGSTIHGEMTSLKQQLAESTAILRADIAHTRDSLRDALQVVGQQLLDTIDTSTRVLYNEIGVKAAAIRGDIYASTQFLSQRLDDKGREILGAIEDSKQELKYQIGAEAEKTRQTIDARTSELKSHISTEMSGVREFVDVKTNQVIGVVREEGQSTRVFMDRKTNQVIKVVRDESEQTRNVVRAESQSIQRHIDVKTGEIIGVVREEGRETRQVVTRTFADLRTHVTSEANGIKDRVQQAQNALWNTSTTQYNSLAGQYSTTQGLIRNHTAAIKQENAQLTNDIASIHMAACTRADTTRKEFEMRDQQYSSSLVSVVKGVHQVQQELDQLGRLTLDLMHQTWTAVTYRGLGALFKFFKSVVTFDFSGGVDAVKDGLGTFASRDYLKGNQKRVEKMGELVKDTGKKMNDLSLNLWNLQTLNWNKWEWMVKEMTQGNVDTAVGAILESFNQFTVAARPALVGDIIANLQQALDVSCEALADVDATHWPGTSGGAAVGLALCRATTTTVGSLQDKMMESLQLVETLRSLGKDYLAQQTTCTGAKGAKAWAQQQKRRLRQTRALQQQQVDTSANEPYFAMAYTGLTKIILDYLLQEAAHQFCKFYEYKNGGVAPPMCGSGSSRTYYTLAQIQLMRAWNPPQYNTVGLRAFLPTQPEYSETHNKSYPYLDLSRLRNGDALFVSLPTWDPVWLQRYGWISPSMPVEQTPSVYVSSIRIHMPVTANESMPDHASSNLAVTVKVSSTRDQYLGLNRRDRQYVLPMQHFTYGAVYGDAVCAPSATTSNVFHSIAGCVRDDGSSDVCVRETGATQVTTTEQLLPSLFSPWRVQVDFSKPQGQAMDVFIPKAPSRAANRTSANLLIPVDLTLIQVTSTATPEAAPATPEPEAAEISTTTCCAADEFRVARNTCQKCPTGTAAVLRGYACVAV